MTVEKMELISQAILENTSDSNSTSLVENGNEIQQDQDNQRRKVKKKRKKRVLCLLVLMVFSFEVMYIITSKLTFEEIEKLLHYMTSSNVSLHYSDQ